MKHPDKYKYILKAGHSLMNALFSLFAMIWKTEVIPDSWMDSELIQLWKGRGLKSD